MRNLNKYDYAQHSRLSKQEFIEAMSHIYPPATTAFKRVRYEMAELHYEKDKVPLKRLAVIGAYCLLESTRNREWTVPPLDIAGDKILYSKADASGCVTLVFALTSHFVYFSASDSNGQLLAAFIPGSRKFTSMEALYDPSAAKVLEDIPLFGACRIEPREGACLVC